MSSTKSKYDEDFHPSEAVALGKQKKSVCQIAAAFDVSRTAIYYWMEKYPKFKEAMELAQTYAQAGFEDIGQDALALPSSAFNAQLWNRQMTARFRKDYNESKDINLGGQKDNPIKTQNTTLNIDLSDLSDEQLAALELLAGSFENGDDELLGDL